MLDRERVLAKIDELEGYLKELKAIVPTDYNEYLSSVEKRREEPVKGCSRFRSNA